MMVWHYLFQLFFLLSLLGICVYLFGRRRRFMIKQRKLSEAAKQEEYNNLVDIFGSITLETKRSYLFQFRGDEETVWLPKSQCKWYKDEEKMTMPEWLALEKGLI